MALSSNPTEPPSGLTIAHKDDDITITTMTTPPSVIKTISRAQWYAAYGRLREKHTEKVVDFEEDACSIFQLPGWKDSSNALGRAAGPGLHDMAPNTVLGAIHRWTSDLTCEVDVQEEEDQAHHVLLSIKKMLSRNMQDSPIPHLAWAAACLCIQKLADRKRPAPAVLVLAYIVARIASYDRLSRFEPKVPVDGQTPLDKYPLNEDLVDMYSNVLEQLIVSPALKPRKRRAQQECETLDLQKLGLYGMALDFSMDLYARNKALEESIIKFAQLQASPSTNYGRDDLNAHSVDGFVHGKIQTLLCVAPTEPPPLLPPALLPPYRWQSVLEDLGQWAVKQDAYQRWRNARSADDGDSNDRILYLHGPEGSSVTMLLHALVQAEKGSRTAETEAGRPGYAVACAFWNWSRDLNGTSVVSILRDLIWTVLAAQPKLQKHLEEAVQATGRRSLLDGNSNSLQAQYAVRGTSCDFYAMLGLLCSIVSDPEFAPTCFVFDYMEVKWDEGDGNESCKKGRDDPAYTAQKRAWTLHDLMELVRTTCRLSPKVAWIVRSIPLSPPSSSVGGCHLHSPEEPMLGKVMHGYIRTLFQYRADPAYTAEMIDHLASELTGRADGNVAWSTLAVDLVARCRLPWHAMRALQRLPNCSAGLGPLLDHIFEINTIRDDAEDHRVHVYAALRTAALAFQPLMVSELAALAGLPATVDAAILLGVLARPFPELRDVYDGSGRAQKYAYFSSRAVLVDQRARLAKATAASDLHVDMACRHLRQLARHYGDTGQRRRLSLYTKLAWLRHLSHVDIGRSQTDDPLAMNRLREEVDSFAAQYARKWLRDLDTLGTIDVVRLVLQDLLPSARGREQLSPIQVVLKTLVMRISRSMAWGMSVVEMDRFMVVAGCEQNDDGDDLPVLPQALPISLPPLGSSTTGLITTLEGHRNWASSAQFLYDGRLIVVAVPNGTTLRFWDRASSRMQHATHCTTQYCVDELLLSPADPNLLVTVDIGGIQILDLALGAVPICTKSRSQLTAEWKDWSEQHVSQKPGEPLYIDLESGVEDCLWPRSMRFSHNDVNDIIVKCEVQSGPVKSGLGELVLGMPQLNWKSFRRITSHEKIVPTELTGALSKSECKDAIVANNMELAAVVHTDGRLLIYKTNPVELQQTIHWEHSRFVAVHYYPPGRVFVTLDERKYKMFHFVQERGYQAEQGEGKPTEPLRKSLIRSYTLPHPDSFSYAVSTNQDEMVLMSRYMDECRLYKIMEPDAETYNDAGYGGRIPNISSSLSNEEAERLLGSVALVVFSHDGARAATSNRKGQIQLWNLAHIAANESKVSDASDLTLWRTLPQSTTGAIGSLSFSSDDKQLLVSHLDGPTFVWDIEAGRTVAMVGEKGELMKFAIFSPGNALVATAPLHQSVRLWDLKKCEDIYLDPAICTTDAVDTTYHYFLRYLRMPTAERLFVSLNRSAMQTYGTVAFSPDGRFLATPGSLGHIWDISPNPASNAILPGLLLEPCASLCFYDAPENDDHGESDDEYEVDEDYDDADHDSDLDCGSFVFSPDSRSLFGFCSDGRLLVWTRTLGTPLSPPASSSSSDSWKPRATLLARGFAIPGQETLWAYQPRRLSVSEETDGTYLLHTEIGVWVLPSLPTDGNAGLHPSPRHPCNVVRTTTHTAILWQNRLLIKFPSFCQPSHHPIFRDLACDIHTVNGSMRGLLFGTRTGHLYYIRFREGETNM